MPEEVPLEIKGDETMVRAVLHPLFYSSSGQNLKREAFLPPPGRKDVSLLRRRYTTDDFCKQHGKSLFINGQTYCGLAVFRAAHISQLNACQEVKADLRATPLDTNKRIVSGRAVFSDDPGLPMHADLVYDRILEKGEAQSKMRMYANEILKEATYFHDLQPLAATWTGPALDT